MSIASVFNTYAHLFDIKGENDDAEVEKYRARPEGHILVAFRFKDSPNIWRKCLRLARNWFQSDKSEFTEWHDTFVSTGLVYLLAHAEGERGVHPDHDAGRPGEPYFDEDDALCKMPWFLVPATPAEQADLPDSKWENFNEDPREYRVSYAQAYSIPEDFFIEARNNGLLVQAGDDGRFWVAF